ncbi:DUF5703 family protein [Georgenia subflava]|uniref:Uncharacterized protein n=1 Tax=Georgenia subflava TaxID=1622177 RepID=A0A6N7ECM7_9MICO|nr:DUF5703 family protein [Georgenia subflava]MPV35730.1 hypothetical protein [Georgenia subflava]
MPRKTEDATASQRVGAGAAYYEYRTVTLPGTVSRGDVRKLLTDEAEYGRWELARTRIYLGGTRRVWLRRRAMKVPSTL